MDDVVYWNKYFYKRMGIITNSNLLKNTQNL